MVQFARYSNAGEPFYPKRHERQPAKKLERTNDLVLPLKAQKQVIPVDAPDRLRDHDAGQAVVAVSAPALGVDYVDRELLAQRTTSPARWEDGTHNRGGLRLDVLLADVRTRTPIVAELKLPARA